MHRPPASGRSASADFDVDTKHLYHHGQWLNFVTGGDFGHQFVTSFAWSTDEFQFGRIQVPPNRITNAIQIPGERVYYPLGEGQLVVNIMETNDSIIGGDGDALFVPAGVAHQFQNPDAKAVEAAFCCSAPLGGSLYE